MKYYDWCIVKTKMDLEQLLDIMIKMDDYFKIGGNDDR